MGEGIQMYLMSDHSGQQTVIRKLGGLAVNKQGSHKFHMERFNLKKLNEVKDKEKYRVEVSNTFAALEDLDAEFESNTLWETIRESIKISAKESLGF
jgi:hypothetical protein